MVRALVLLLALLLLPSCTVLDRMTRSAGRAFGLMGDERPPPGRDPLNIHLQLAMISDYAVTQLLQSTEGALDAATTPSQRILLLRMRLDYATALWNAASGPNPFANAIDMMVTLSVGRKRAERPEMAAALGKWQKRVLDVLTAAQHDSEAVVRGFISPAEYQALALAVAARGVEGAEGAGLESIDLQQLLARAEHRAEKSEVGPMSLFRVLGVDPFSSLDPATREIAESRQFGERLLFSLQRMPYLMRLNAQLLANEVAEDIELPVAIASLERASSAMSQVAQTAAALPDRFASERAALVAEVRSQAEQLGTLARDYRGAFEAGSLMATSTNQVLQSFDGIVARLDAPGDPNAPPSRPFDILDYAQTAERISVAATNLSGLLGSVEQALEGPGITRLTPQAEAVLASADQRGRGLLWAAFWFGCGLIAIAAIAVIVTSTVLRRMRGRTAGRMVSG